MKSIHQRCAEASCACCLLADLWLAAGQELPQPAAEARPVGQGPDSSPPWARTIITATDPSPSHDPAEDSDNDPEADQEIESFYKRLNMDWEVRDGC